MHIGLQLNLGDAEQRHPTWGKATYRMGVNRQLQPYAVNGFRPDPIDYGRVHNPTGRKPLLTASISARNLENVPHRRGIEESFVESTLGFPYALLQEQLADTKII